MDRLGFPYRDHGPLDRSLIGIGTRIAVVAGSLAFWCGIATLLR